MKMRKVALRGTIAAATGLALVATLAACGPSEAPVDIYKFDPATADGVLDVYLNYGGTDGITLRKPNFENTVEGVNYVQNDLLPLWRFYQAKLNQEIKEASNYSADDNDKIKTALDTGNFMSETDNSRKIDIFYNSTANIETFGKENKVIDLKEHLDDMPNFKAFLANNPSIEAAITKGGKIYYTPYFDGYNAIERMLIMDTNMVKSVLDVEDSADTKDAAVNTTTGLKALEYQPFMNADFNYAADQEVTISKNAKTSKITLKKTENIIKQQNTAGSKSGKEMRKQLRDYVKAVLGDNFGSGKTYEKLSDFFVSEQAAYNSDELIALMRVVKASPELITGDAAKEITMLTPRGAEKSRVDNIADFIQIWGIQGMDSEKEMLYFDANGKLNDAASTPATYDALEYLSQIYDEGLIMKDFYKTSTLGKTGYLDKYFGKTQDNGGYGFMLYDYSASTGATNSTKKDGNEDYIIGTDDSKRVGTFANTSVTGVMPILPPLTYWADNKDYSYDQALANHTNKVLMRYSDSDRALKSTSWAIPADSDNIAGALKLMDYMFDEEGVRYNDFGPDYYWTGKIDSFEYGGQKSPEISKETQKMIASTQTDFWSFMRGYIGATHGIGYVRSASINYQATNEYAKIGTKNIENAIASGAVTLALMDNPKYASATTKAGFASAVPSAGYTAPGTNPAKEYAAVTAFWATDKYGDTAKGWTKYITDAAGTYDKTNTTKLGDDANKVAYSYKTVWDQMNARVKTYLYTMANTQNANMVPDYAKTTA